MKKFLCFAVVLCGLLSLAVAGCDSDDDLSPSAVPATVLAQFAEMYPGTVAHWEAERGLLKGEFRMEGREVAAWFRPDGEWVMTVTAVYPPELPQAVRDYAAQQFPERYIDDADWVETPSESYYLLELDGHGMADVYAKVSAEGTPVP